MTSPSQDIPWLLDPVTIESSDIPNGPNVDIRESKYFQKWEKLPATQEVRSEAAVKYSAAHPDRPLDPGYYLKPPFVTFEDQNLFVKWGTRIRISEGQCLFAIHRQFGAAVPVPEVYGWRMEGAVVYIFMEFIRGQTLDSAWDTLEADGRTSICLQLRTILHNLRLAKQDDQTPLIGNIKGGTFLDRAIGESFQSECSSFRSVKEFHDWFMFLPRRPMKDPYSVPIEPFRKDLSDTSEIKLTHGDLHRTNIMVTAGKSPRVVAIIDWEQSGWFPAYWEARKAFWTAWHGSEWADQYLPMILDPYQITEEPWDYYVSSLGN